MNITRKYLEALKSFDDWVIVSDWAIRFGERYPDLLEKANQEAVGQAQDTTGLREIAARISSAIARGAYDDAVEIDSSERPRKVRFIPEEQRQAHEEREIEEDVAPLRRDEIVRKASQEFSVQDRYRAGEFDAVARQLKAFFGLDFEVDHATALLNKGAPGAHSPENLQLLLKSHNGKKSNNNWQRFTYEDQIEYIKAAIKLQEIVAPRIGIEMESNVLEALISRIKDIY